MKKETTKKIVFTATFAALGYALSYLEFPLFAAVPFLKLDFSNVTTMLAGFLLGPACAFVSELIKQLLCFATKSSTGGVGELANLMVTMAYVLPASVLYLFKKGKTAAAVGLLMGTLLEITVALLSNAFILFPLFGLTIDVFNSVLIYIILFNVIKCICISVLVMLLYKSLSRALKQLFK